MHKETWPSLALLVIGIMVRHRLKLGYQPYLPPQSSSTPVVLAHSHLGSHPCRFREHHTWSQDMEGVLYFPRRWFVLLIIYSFIILYFILLMPIVDCVFS